VSLEAAERIRIGGADLEVRRLGAGPPLLFLHGEAGLLFAGPVLARLAEHFEVVAPTHPGWAGSTSPAHVKSLDDIAYLYLDLLEAIGSPVSLVGVSIGGWLAAEMATKSTEWLTSVVFVAPLGVKLGGPMERTFVDLYATSPEVIRECLYGDTGRAPDRATLSDDDFVALATAEEAVARYGWEPYLHNPKLRYRLARIKKPALVIAGSDDRFVVAPDYYRSFAGFIGSGTEVAVMDGGGHRLEEELPDELARGVVAFCRQHVVED
jgi:pimeloyl-ACP methyl ester carboxylesterase